MPWNTIHIADSELGARSILSALAESRPFAAQANDIVAGHWPTMVRPGRVSASSGAPTRLPSAAKRRASSMPASPSCPSNWPSARPSARRNWAGRTIGRLSTWGRARPTRGTCWGDCSKPEQPGAACRSPKRPTKESSSTLLKSSISSVPLSVSTRQHHQLSRRTCCRCSTIHRLAASASCCSMASRMRLWWY